MLNIPEQVKSLFNRDDIRKNIRITFPQSGRPDITNDNIAAETLSFAESVCSQSTFKYGLAEASVIEFETVGVANMLGEIIEAWVEIDATTLPEELQTERDDLTFPVYPVPLGRFVVTACPRNHEAMAHRKVRAMSQIDISDIISANDCAILTKQFEVFVNAGLVLNKSYDAIAVEWGETAPAAYITTKATYTPADYGTTVYDNEIAIPGLKYYEENVNVYTRGLYNIMPEPQSVWEMQRFTQTDIKPAHYETFINQLIDQIMERYGVGIRYVNSIGEWKRATRDDVAPFVRACLFPERILCDWQIGLRSDTFQAGFDMYANLPKPTNWTSIPTLRKGSATTAKRENKGAIYWSMSAYGSRETDPKIETYEITGDNPTISIQTYERPLENCNNLQALRFTLETKQTGVSAGGSFKYVSFQAIDIMQTAVLAYLELAGAFGSFSRAGGKYIKRLETEPAVQLTRAQYESAWWDEYDLAPVGAIAYKIGTDDMLYQFGNGASVYKLNYEKIFETLKITSEQKINEILDVALVPELQKLMYTPVEIDAHGLPYLEAGDCIELEADDGTIIKTYVLERKLTGIQNLRDQITADGITIAEVNV